jgi:folate-binding protein YgfZ
MPLIACPDRCVISVSGSESEPLLQRLITSNLDLLKQETASYGALLAPQGKILLDFLVIRQQDSFWFDLDAELAEIFIKKMTLYKMRSDVTIAQTDLAVAISLPADDESGTTGGIKDPRHDLLGRRHYLLQETITQVEPDNEARLAAHIASGVPQGGTDQTMRDFLYGDVFPHDVNLDQLGGIDYDKGCYLGQEVVSRIHHRGTARKRFVQISGDAELTSHDAILAGGKTIGQIGMAVQKSALAQIRLDRLAAAQEQGVPIQSEQGQILTITMPSYANFSG